LFLELKMEVFKLGHIPYISNNMRARGVWMTSYDDNENFTCLIHSWGINDMLTGKNL
jgi:hypothetical protein